KLCDIVYHLIYIGEKGGKNYIEFSRLSIPFLLIPTYFSYLSQVQTKPSAICFALFLEIQYLEQRHFCSSCPCAKSKIIHSSKHFYLI
ncbi:LOW QUALITY PROTEIN: hypothetical protein MXB_5398, partial [Myxobolus squamalis]